MKSNSSIFTLLVYGGHELKSDYLMTPLSRNEYVLKINSLPLCDLVEQ